MTRFAWGGGSVALDLCNTAGRNDALSSPEALAAWLAEAGRRAPPIVTMADLEDVRALRDGLRPALVAADRRALGALAEGWLAGAPGRLQVDPVTLESRFRPAGDTCRSALVPIVLDALDLLRLAPGRVRECAADGCTAVYVDTSRNRSRRWCSMDRCGARAKAQAYYQRRRGVLG